MHLGSLWQENEAGLSTIDQSIYFSTKPWKQEYSPIASFFSSVWH